MGSTTIEQPSTPAAPTTSQSMSDYIENYPRLFQLMQEYAPKEAQMNVDLASQYALPAAQALKTAQDTLYPNETALTNTLTQQAQEGMSGTAPDWYNDKWSDFYNANLGTNAGSPAGANYYSTAMMEQQKNWGDYYRNLGMSISGKQPVYTAQNPSYTNQMSSYTPSSVATNNMQGYSTYSNLYGKMYNTNAQTASQGNPYLRAGAGILGMGLGGYLGGL